MVKHLIVDAFLQPVSPWRRWRGSLQCSQTRKYSERWWRRFGPGPACVSGKGLLACRPPLHPFEIAKAHRKKPFTRLLFHLFILEQGTRNSEQGTLTCVFRAITEKKSVARSPSERKREKREGTVREIKRQCWVPLTSRTRNRNKRVSHNLYY